GDDLPGRDALVCPRRSRVFPGARPRRLHPRQALDRPRLRRSDRRLRHQDHRQQLRRSAMLSQKHAATNTTTAARRPVSIWDEKTPHAADQPTVTARELPSAVPLMALSTGFWAFKTLAAAHELGLFSHLAGGAGTTVAELAEAIGLHPRPAEMLLT